MSSATTGSEDSDCRRGSSRPRHHQWAPSWLPARACNKGILPGRAFHTVAARLIPHARAAILTRPSTPVTVRFSNATGRPNIPDNDPNAGPRGMAIRFHLAEHVHTDIIAHSVDRASRSHRGGIRVEFLRAAGASGPDAASPKPIETFLAKHPTALEFVQMPKPLPASFFAESFFGVNAYRFYQRRRRKPIRPLSHPARWPQPVPGCRHRRATDAELPLRCRQERTHQGRRKNAHRGADRGQRRRCERFHRALARRNAPRSNLAWSS